MPGFKQPVGQALATTTAAGLMSAGTMQRIDPLETIPSYGLITGLFNGPGATDYIQASTTVDGIFIRQVSGTAAAAAAQAGEAGRPGINRFSAGTDATGRAASATLVNGLLTTDGVLRWRGAFRIPTASDGTNTFSLRAGFISSVSAEGVRTAEFRYQHTVNSGLLECVTRNASVETGTAFRTLINPVNASTFVTCEVEIDVSGNQVRYWINGALQCTHTANIPSGTIGAGIMLLKSAGASDCVFDADHQVVRQFGPTR